MGWYEDERVKAESESTPKHELDNDLPAYLSYLILSNVHRLRQVSPDHILVKAVEAALAAADDKRGPD